MILKVILNILYVLIGLLLLVASILLHRMGSILKDFRESEKEGLDDVN